MINSRVLLLIPLAAFFMSGSTVMHSGVDDRDLERAMVELADCDFLAATDAMRYLFAAGRPALGYLLDHLEDDTIYHGLCGRKILKSQATVVEEHDSIEREHEPDTTIGELSLYLIVAVLREDLYFADSCKPLASDPLSVKSAQRAIKQLAEESLQQGSRLERDEIEQILKDSGVTFPGRIDSADREDAEK